MKKISIILVLTLTIFAACEKDNNPMGLTDGFCVLVGSEYVLNHDDIDYYDYSSHLIYLKNSNSFLNDFETGGGFKVYADKEEMYTGSIQPAYSSWLPSSPVIHSQPFLFREYIVSIDYTHLVDSTGNVIPDIRENDKIIQSLKKYNQFHAGLSCEIESIEYSPGNNEATINLHLQNNDSFGYYYLDPEKMGMELFHYFTNGLQIRDFSNQMVYSHKTASKQPEPWDSWKMEWVSVIESNENKLITITYPDFDILPEGELKAFFTFPGLTYQVDKNDIEQENGRIWLGKLQAVKQINV